MFTLKSLIAPALLAVTLVAGCKRAPQWRSSEGVVWHTSYHIVYGGEHLGSASLDDSITAVLARVERSLSPFDSTSLVSRVNRSAGPVEVDSAFALVFGSSRQVASVSGGAFDPTVSPLVNLWGFGFTGRVAEPPSDACLAEALLLVGIDSCRLEGSTLYKKSPGTQFNFSAITKGYACDEVGRMLRRNGAENYMVEIGGEIAVAGHNPEGRKWRIMIDAPVENDTAVIHSRMAMVELADCGVATSGNYRNYRDFGNFRAGHTISASTGRPVTTTTLSAAVVAPDAMLADALATACMAMDADSALAMIERIEGAELLLAVLNPADSTVAVRRTPAFPVIGD